MALENIIDTLYATVILLSDTVFHSDIYSNTLILLNHDMLSYPLQGNSVTDLERSEFHHWIFTGVNGILNVKNSPDIFRHMWLKVIW